jgi:nucleoside-diphosphate-sugar epimerase
VQGAIWGVIVNYLSTLAGIDCITAMVHNKPFRSPIPHPVNIIKMDIRSPELADAVAGHDFVIHTAHVLYWTANMPAAVRDDINYNGARNLARAAVKHKACGFLHASSVAAYDPLLSHEPIEKPISGPAHVLCSRE